MDINALAEAEDPVWAWLECARSHVSAGEPQAAELLAKAVLDHALESGNFRLQGEAMHCLAVSELRLLGRFDRALELAERATLCFQRCHDEAGECSALAAHAIASVRLGRNERAMESALLAVRLAEGRPDLRKRVLAYHALGVAAYSGRNFDESRNAYQRAIQMAHQCDPPLNVFELHVDLAFTECLLYFTERNLGGARLSLDAMQRYLAECHRLRALDGGNISLSPGSHANNLLVLQMADLLRLIWSGNLDGARRALVEYGRAARLSNRPWMLATECWAQAEVAMLAGELDHARSCAEDMIAIAERHRHETLSGIGYQLASHVCQSQGDYRSALDALQRLLRREQAARAEALKTRVNVIEWQLELRHNQQQVERLESTSRLFEKLAMEDALTGLANRRRLEAELAETLAALPSSGQSVCVALVDVDGFKQVNDRFSHHAGDEVLKAIAAVFRRNVRDSDLCARLGGDEFVLLLRDTSLDEAGDICHRIDAEVRGWDGSHVVPGLRASVSIGVTRAEAGDTGDGLLQRSDARMYAIKAGRLAMDRSGNG